MSESPLILLLTDNPDHRRQWRDALSPLAGRVLEGVDELDHASKPDVVVTDRPMIDEALAADNLHLAHGKLGVIAVGSGHLADVSLPADCTARELRIACQLLIEIVRLRREQRRGERTRKVLSQLALCDPLTGLPNRRAWDAELANRWRAAKSSAEPLFLALFDVDHFKRINDQFGHLAGDAVLKTVGRTLSGLRCQRSDYVARLGGDEFAMLACGLDFDASIALVERVRTELFANVQRALNHELTISAGLAFANSNPATKMDRLFSAADNKLREAKSLGRNRTVSAKVE